MTDSILTKHQTREFILTEPVYYKVVVRYDDQCGNGHNTFSITSDNGCDHERIARKFPELAPLIKWHLCSSDGPMHYIPNTLCHAGDRDCHGLRKGETRQIRNGRTGKLSWKLEADSQPEQYVDADECPTATVTLRYVPWNRVGEGKKRELNHARSSAIWPEATDEELSVPPEELKAKLEARLPALMVEFRQAVESLGFVY